MTASHWMILGFIGQFFFTMRFVVQWWVSERRKASVIPLTFWHFSLLGGLILLAYAIYKRDPVWIVGQSTGSLIYARNLMFLRRGAAPKSDRHGADERVTSAPSLNRPTMRKQVEV